MTAPDPATGGSYVGFADLGVDISDEPEIVPDRFEDVADPAASTTRLNREALFGRKPPSEGGYGTREEAEGPAERIEGLTGAFEREERAVPAPGPRPATTTEEPAWTPPPEAPPAETWQAADETDALPQESQSDESHSRPGPAIGGATAGSGNGSLSLTPEAIELIAERVVERLSDRVVREIAWEVIPQVAEALVRRRIKELEKGESS